MIRGRYAVVGEDGFIRTKVTDDDDQSGPGQPWMSLESANQELPPDQSLYLKPWRSAERFQPELADLSSMTDDALAIGTFVELSSAQRKCVRALLNGKSVMYSCAGETFLGSFVRVIEDTACRAALWGQRIIVCLPSRAIAIATYLHLKEKSLDQGFTCSFDVGDGPGWDSGEGGPTVTVTVPLLLRDWTYVDMLGSCDIVFMIEMAVPGSQFVSRLWEDIVFGIPLKTQICFASSLSVNQLDAEEFPLWFSSFQGPLEMIVANRWTQDPPSLFLYNGTENHAWQSSLLQIRLEQVDGKYVAPSISPETRDLQNFDDLIAPNSTDQMEYVDMATLVLDAVVESAKGKEANETLPVCVLASGRGECEIVASTVAAMCASRNLNNLVDSRKKAVLDQATNMAMELMKEAHSSEGDSTEMIFLEMLSLGIFVCHAGVVPALRVLGERLFLKGLVKLIIVDINLGGREIAMLPPSPVVVVPGTSLGQSPDVSGLIFAQVLTCLNTLQNAKIYFSWNDNLVSEEEAVHEILSCLNTDTGPILSVGIGHEHQSVLSLLARFGKEDWPHLYRYRLDHFRNEQIRMVYAVNHAILDNRFQQLRLSTGSVDWELLADFHRLRAKLQEAKGMLSIMMRHSDSSRVKGIYSHLLVTKPGALLGLRSQSAPRTSVIMREEDMNMIDYNFVLSNVEQTMEPVVFIRSVGSQSSKEHSMMSDRVFCIGSDGRFLLVEVNDILAIGQAPDRELEKLAAGVVTPPISLLDKDTQSGYLCGTPFPGSNASALAKFAIAEKVRGAETLKLFIPEEIRLVQKVVQDTEGLIREHSWYGRDEEMEHLIMQRKELADAEAALEKIVATQNFFRSSTWGFEEESEVQAAHEADIESVVQALSLTQCISEGGSAITPFGLLVSRLRCADPLWIAALVTFNNFNAMTSVDLAALLCAASTRLLPEFGSREIVEPREGSSVISTALQIQREILFLERKRKLVAMTSLSWTGFVGCDPILDTRLARAMYSWASGQSWGDSIAFCDDVDAGDIIENFQETLSLLVQLADPVSTPMLPPAVHEMAAAACSNVRRFPVVDTPIIDFLTSTTLDMSDNSAKTNSKAPPRRGRRKATAQLNSLPSTAEKFRKWAASLTK
eukprot:CAMPEP_0184688312 /NCGR_PEP_ID=MMETSP0312-20130426/29416_1 /TAXON_ID=31354 /ORGANISM="Compsopogon coeruleus, Strain SAG 36.94" /LENGTH=1127 /DNA_ID=CAMNT_0027145321 /DNA_START=237 /DNA_END=3620 /DNA_ORIENTATION=-